MYFNIEQRITRGAMGTYCMSFIIKLRVTRGATGTYFVFIANSLMLNLEKSYKRRFHKGTFIFVARFQMDKLRP